MCVLDYTYSQKTLPGIQIPVASDNLNAPAEIDHEKGFDLESNSLAERETEKFSFDLKP